METPKSIAKPKSRRDWMVVAILSVACLFMTLLSVEQTRTIEMQRTLIHQLFRDSVQLNALRMQYQQARHN